MSKTQVAVLMGSESDLDTMQACLETLDAFGVGYAVRILSAHRTPEQLRLAVRRFARGGVDVFIAAAGMAAHLAGAVAAHTSKPVIGVPMSAGPLGGVDALLSTVQMPKGLPVATVAVGKAGAVNAAILAVQILANGSAALARKLEQYRQGMAAKVSSADKRLQRGKRNAR
ncbi:MAG: 5-(carboxyamino)imidazole ribonucleotide mutase [Planctomycetes bacterium]|nr:5-(carboxyamino)imidazole ribonucleotide mutase [Planctomycetota bacterium]